MFTFIKQKPLPLTINWTSLQQTEIDDFVSECNEKAQRYDVFDVTISKRLYDYLFSNPTLWGNFVLAPFSSPFDGTIVVARDGNALKEHVDMP